LLNKKTIENDGQRIDQHPPWPSPSTTTNAQTKTTQTITQTHVTQSTTKQQIDRFLEISRMALLAKHTKHLAKKRDRDDAISGSKFIVAMVYYARRFHV
jgi:hypothetical protein